MHAPWGPLGARIGGHGPVLTLPKGLTSELSSDLWGARVGGIAVGYGIGWRPLRLARAVVLVAVG